MHDRFRALVRAAFPAGVSAAVVAGEAGLIGLGRRHLRELEDVPFRIVVDVRLPGTVTALAAVGRRRRARILRLAVRRAFQRGDLVLVADGAGVAARVAAAARPPVARQRFARGPLRSAAAARLHRHCARHSRPPPATSHRDTIATSRPSSSARYRNAIRKFARSYAAGSGILPRLMFPRISPSERPFVLAASTPRPRRGLVRRVVRAVPKQRRHHLRRVRAGHRRLDDVEAGVDAAGDRDRSP